MAPFVPQKFCGEGTMLGLSAYYSLLHNDTQPPPKHGMVYISSLTSGCHPHSTCKARDLERTGRPSRSVSLSGRRCVTGLGFVVVG